MRTFICIIGSVLIATAVSAAAPQKSPDIAVSVSVPSSVVDAAPLRATVTVRNASNRPLALAAPRPDATVAVRIIPLEDFRSGKCHTRVIRHAPAQAVTRTTVAPRGEVTADIDLLRSYPFGLQPGRYRLFVDYRDGALAATSAPAEFELVAPASEDYQSFLHICRALAAGQGADQVLPFVRRSPRFVYADALLEYARNRAEGEPRVALNQLILERGATAEAADHAQRDLRDLAARSRELAAYTQYLQVFREQLRDPANAAAARDFQQLGTILDDAGFERHEQFLRKHPRSFFAAEALHGVIEAVSHGVFPRGTSVSDGDRLLVSYYGLLLRADERSYWVQRARRDPAVKRLMARGARE